MIRIIIRIIHIIFGIAFPFSVYVALLSPMMFDAPGSTENILVWLLFIAVFTFPLMILTSIIASWGIARSGKGYKMALVCSLLPCLNIALFFISMGCIEIFQNGSFAQ